MPHCQEHIAIVQQLEDMKEDITRDLELLFNRSWPSWARSVLISVLGALIVLYGSLWVYAQSNYATREDVEVLRVEAKDQRREILESLRRIEDRIDPQIYVGKAK